MSKTPFSQLTAPLLQWYGENARDLPWRRSPDAYRVWVSEIMLQQTRVTAVLGYYARFLESFPSVEALAAADEERLLKLWEGLGYYSRARNLQRAAKRILEEHNGRFPDTYETLTTLPGIGDYTAGAVLSIAFSQRVPAVDGNVLRLVARIDGSQEDITVPAARQAFRARVLASMPEAAQCGMYNQALMDLGATVCLPNGAPLCAHCPAETFCVARREGSALTLPVKTPKKKRRIEERTVFVLSAERGAALRKRPEAGLLAGLWEFPSMSGTLDEGGAAQVLAHWGLEPVEWEKKLSAKHIFTHVEWHMTGYVLRVRGLGPADLLWLDRAGLEEVAVPSAFTKFLPEAKRLLAETARCELEEG